MLLLCWKQMKHLHGGHRFKRDTNVETNVKRWIKYQDIGLYRQETENLFPLYDLRLGLHGNYV